MPFEDAAIWTVSPNGIVNRQARLSIVASPRIFGPKGTVTSLRESKTFLDWPAAIKEISFVFEAQQGSWSSSRPPAFTASGPSMQARAVPSNLGSAGFDERLWSKVFDENTRVEVYEDSARPPRDAVPVFFRHDVVRAIVNEVQRFQVFEALGSPGVDRGSSTNNTLLFLDEMSALPDLAFGVPDPDAVSRFRYLNAAEMISGFEEFAGYKAILDDLRKSQSDRPAYLSPDLSVVFGSTKESIAQAIGFHLTMLQLYHGVGVRNRNSKIRGRRSRRDSDPDVLTLSSNELTLSPADDGKMYQFAEPLRVNLPSLDASAGGYQVCIGYLPDARPEQGAESDRLLAHQFAGGDSAVEVFSGPTLIGQIKRFDIKRVWWTGSKWLLLTTEPTEFHAAVSALSTSPILVRRLGLVFDFNIFSSDLFGPGGRHFEGRIRVLPNLPHSDCANASPWTAFSVGEINVPADSARHQPQLISFHPRLGYSEEDPLVAGMRRMTDLGASAYNVTNSAMKVLQDARRRKADKERGEPRLVPNQGTPKGAARAGLIADDKAPDFDRRSRPSSLHTVGFCLSAQNEALRLERAISRNAAQNVSLVRSIETNGVQSAFAAATRQTLFYEDLLYGYVPDVQVEEESAWYSLAERRQSFWFDRDRRRRDDERQPDFVAPNDEGWIGVGVDTQVDENGTVHLRISENLIRWDGYSVIIPRPGEPVPDVNDNRAHGSRPAAPRSDEIPVRIVSAIAPHSLAKLRYPRTYSFRARVKDVAGNAWELGEVNRILRELASIDPSLASALHTPGMPFLRWDPISSPNIMPLQAPGPSDLGVSTEVTGGSHQDGAPSSRSPDSTTVLAIRSGIDSRFKSSRWLFAAPEIGLLEAEWSGMLDIFRGPKAAYKVLRQQYARKLDKDLYAALLAVLKWPGSRALSTPYIPDIHAAGTAFGYLPGRERPPDLVAITKNDIPHATLLVDFAVDPRGPVHNKPYSQPFILQLTGGKRSSRYNRATRTLQVSLPPGEQQTVLYGCYPDPARLKDFALVVVASSANRSPTLLQKILPDALESDVASLFQAGLISAITPRTTLRLLHAIPKPLYAASFSSNPSVSPRRTFGKAVIFEDTVKVHRASTARLDIECAWTEYSDSRGASWPPTSPGHLQPPLSVNVDLPDLTTAPDSSHETKHLKIRHNFPDTKFRKVRYRIRATTRYRDYFDKELTSNPDNITRVSVHSKELYVLNSAPPDPLVIEYILPTFRWTTKGPDRANEQTEVKRATGLRIFMRRPWPSSGEGEALGIILEPSEPPNDRAVAGPDEDPPPFYSEIGGDPIRIDSSVSRRYLALSDFEPVDADHQVRGCLAFDHPLKNVPTIEPSPDPEGQIPTVEDRQIDPVTDNFTLRPYDVAVFDVQFDRSKGLMFADVDLVSRKEYFPFVRFVAARYQRHSAPYAFLSTPTAADFVQIAPERVVTIIRERVPANSLGATKVVLTIKVMGPMHGDRAKGSLLNEVELTAMRSMLDFGDFDHLPLQVDLSTITDGDKKLQVWSTQIDASRLSGFRQLRVREYEVYNMNAPALEKGSRRGGFKRRLVYLAHVPIR